MTFPIKNLYDDSYVYQTNDKVAEAVESFYNFYGSSKFFWDSKLKFVQAEEKTCFTIENISKTLLEQK